MFSELLWKSKITLSTNRGWLYPILLYPHAHKGQKKRKTFCLFNDVKTLRKLACPFPLHLSLSRSLLHTHTHSFMKIICCFFWCWFMLHQHHKGIHLLYPYGMHIYFGTTVLLWTDWQIIMLKFLFILMFCMKNAMYA